MDLFLIRHGESSNNALEDGSLRVADPELTEKGQTQAECVASHLKEGLHLYPGERESGRPPLDKLYCSAMVRAMHTAQYIGRALDLEPEVWVDIHEIGGIYLDHGGERGTVGYPGLTRGEVAARFPETLASAEVGEDGWWNKDVETWYQGQGRAIGVAGDLVTRAGEQARIGLVSHGGFMNLFLMALGNQLPGNGIYYEHDNTAITRIALEPQHLVIFEYINRTEHLPKELQVPRRLPVV